MDQTVGALVRRALRGEMDACAALVAEFRPRFGRYAFRMLGSREEAEDVLQETFLRAFRRLDRCRDPERFGAWVFAILVNCCRSRLRRSRVDRARLVRDPALVEAATVDHPGEELALREEIARAVAALPPAQREAFLLRHVEDMSYEQMSEVAGASVPALKMRVMRACEALRAALEGVRHES